MRASLMILTTAMAAPAFSAQTISWQPVEFTTRSDETVAAQEGSLQVPARHENPDGPGLALKMVRFPSTSDSPGDPIIYLAGGPGGSGIGTARGQRFPLFQALREVADVIALDQRGTGSSDRGPACVGPEAAPLGRAMTAEDIAEYATQAASHCISHWEADGYDWRQFDTVQSARDLETLRVALGAARLNLWGISYGTHLAFAAMREMEGKIARAVLASPEGLSQTVKLPAYSDAYFERVAALIAADPRASERYPDFLGALRELLEDLAQSPQTVEVPSESGQTVAVAVGAEELRMLIAFGMVKNPEDVARLPGLVYGIKHAGPALVAPMVLRFLGQPLRLDPMAFATDVASGVSQDRLATFKQQARTAIVGEFMNFPMPHVLGVEGLPDLGDAFREEIRSDIPTLILTGTLDGRTFPEEHALILEGLSAGHQIVVENAGHDLFMASPEVGNAIVRFFSGSDDLPQRIRIEPPNWH